MFAWVSHRLSSTNIAATRAIRSRRLSAGRSSPRTEATKLAMHVPGIGLPIFSADQRLAAFPWESGRCRCDKPAACRLSLRQTSGLPCSMYAAADGTRLANLPGRVHRLRSAALEALGSSRRDDDQGYLRCHQQHRRRLRPVGTPCVCGGDLRWCMGGGFDSGLPLFASPTVDSGSQLRSPLLSFVG